MLTFIIHYKAAWDQTIAINGIEVTETPKSYPVLLTFDETQGENSQKTGHFVTVSQASKFLSAVPTIAFQEIDSTIIQSLANKLPQTQKNKAGYIKTKPVNLPELVTYKLVGEDDSEGTKSTSLTTLKTSQELKIGDNIMLDGMSYTIVDIGTSKELMAEDPITNIAGAVQVMDHEPEPLSGIDGIPIDPSKLNGGASIAEGKDEAEHVLDVERDV